MRSLCQLLLFPTLIFSIRAPNYVRTMQPITSSYENDKLATENSLKRNGKKGYDFSLINVRNNIFSIFGNVSLTTESNSTTVEDAYNSVTTSSSINLAALTGGKSFKKNILILMSDTGGGHRASAQALEQAMQEQFPGKFSVNIMDIWTEHAGAPFNSFVPKYRFLAKNPLLWRLFFAYGNFYPTKKFTEFWSKCNSYKSFKKAINASRPDLVVSVHPLCQLLPISAVKEINEERRRLNRGSALALPQVPFVTVVTDLGGAHSTWFDKRADRIFVPSESVHQMAVKEGIAKSKIVQHGLPVRPSFWKPALSKSRLRRNLGLSRDVKTVLLMGGGDGVGSLGTIAAKLAQGLSECGAKSQMIVVCGHNQKLTDGLKSQSWPYNVNVLVKGFVNNVDEYMAASDCLVTKAGPGTIAEAMIRGLPIVLSSFLPGQEAGNVPYVVNGGFGVYTGCKPHRIAKVVSHLFSTSGAARLAEMSARAKELSRPKATYDIARDIASLALNPPPLAPINK